MTPDLKAAKRRLAVMGLVNALAVVAAGVALYAYFGMGISWALGAFVAALAVGIGAQIWFIAGLRRANKGV